MEHPSLPLFAAALLLIVLAGCDTAVEDVEVDLDADYEIFTTGQTLLRATRDDGTIIHYHGDRDADGFPTKLNVVSVQKPGLAEPIVIEMDENRRPGRITSSNRSVLEIEWEDGTSGRIVALSADGQYQATVPFDVSEGVSVDESAVASMRDATPATIMATAGPRRGACEIDVAPLIFSASSWKSQAFLSAQNVIVNVERCSEAVDNALVTLEVDQHGQIGRTVLYGKKIQPGKYQFDVGHADANKIPLSAIGRACSKVTDIVGQGCIFVEQITPPAQTALCSGVGAAIDLAAGGPTGEGALIYAGCMEGITAAQLYCSTLGGSPAPGAPSPADAICAGIKSAGDPGPNATIGLKPAAFIPGKGTVSAESKTFPAGGPYSDFDLNVGGSPSIDAFGISPSDPEPEQGYTASANVTCLTPGSSVTISVVGSDGYSHSESTSVTGSATIRLTVPGAEGGVVDRVTVSINGGPSKTVSIVF